MDIIVFLLGCIAVICSVLPQMRLGALLIGGIGLFVGLIVILIRIKNGGPKSIPVIGTIICLIAFLAGLIIEILIPIMVYNTTPDLFIFSARLINTVSNIQ